MDGNDAQNTSTVQNSKHEKSNNTIGMEINIKMKGKNSRRSCTMKLKLSRVRVCVCIYV